MAAQSKPKPLEEVSGGDLSEVKKKLEERGSASEEDAKEFADELAEILTEKTGYDAGL